MTISPATAARMLEKAQADEVQLLDLGDGTFHTRSKLTKPGMFYLTTVDSCTCPAVAHCKHIVAVRNRVACDEAASQSPQEGVTSGTTGTDTDPQVVQVGSVECLKCRGCGSIAWRGSIVFDKDPDAAYCFDCKAVEIKPAAVSWIESTIFPKAKSA